MKMPLVLVALLLVGCGTAVPPPDAPEPPADDLAGRLAGSEWLSTGVTVGGEDRPLVAGTQIRLAFVDGTVTAQAGCNTLGGAYRIEDDQLVVGEMSGTEMGCDGPRHAQDEWLGGLLGSHPTVEFDGTTLTLTDGDTVVTLEDREVAEPDQPLTGTTWVLDSIQEGGAVSSVPQGASASLVFNDDGTLNAQLGCNAGAGRYAVDGTRLQVEELETTAIACSGAAGAVEEAMRLLLNAEGLDHVIDAGTLMLSTGERGLGFRAAEAP